MDSQLINSTRLLNFSKNLTKDRELYFILYPKRAKLKLKLVKSFLMQRNNNLNGTHTPFILHIQEAIYNIFQDGIS
jgi:hypothetical protein